MSPKDYEKKVAALCHIGVLLSSVLIPIIIYVLKGNESDFIEKSARESINFQITLFIYATISLILTIVIVGFLLLAILVPVSLILVLIASIKYYQGEEYEYPLTIRLL